MSQQKMTANVLVVDDEQNTLNALVRALAPLNISITTADNGLKALELLEREDYVLVLADARMPGIDGVELLGQIAHEQPAARRIILTGCSDVDHAISAINIGKVHRYLRKPWDTNQLRDIISAELATTAV